MIKPDDVILFQGDSITDVGRDRTLQDQPNHAHALGRGYAFIAASNLLADHDPDGMLRVYNRGISGNRVTQLAERWQADCLDLRPTLVSILIGVNDTWHGVANGTPENGVPLDRYEQVYRELLQQTRDELPGVRLVVCEPFSLECGAVLELNFHPDLDERRRIAMELARQFEATWVGFQAMFDEACKRFAPASLAGDGVHPTLAGHQLMARAWLSAVRSAQ